MVEEIRGRGKDLFPNKVLALHVIEPKICGISSGFQKPALVMDMEGLGHAKIHKNYIVHVWRDEKIVLLL